MVERLVVTEALLEVVHHAPVDDVGELALEDPHRLRLGVTALAGVGENALRVDVSTQLGDGHAVQNGVDATVASAVEPVPHRLAGALGGGGRERGRCR